VTLEESAADYQLVWPRRLFQDEASALLNSRGKLNDWDDRCELLLEDAFAGVAPRDDFLAEGAAGGGTTMDDRKRFLLNLLRRGSSLKEVTADRTAYWSERQHNRRPGAVSRRATVRELIRVIEELDRHGYFEKAFDKDCVDAPAEVDPSALLEREIGVADLWPLKLEPLVDNRNLFCDVIEVLHDLVARPRARHLHPYAGCGWHHSAFSLEAGRVLYRWRVNKVLDRSDLGLRLADEGDDTGRLVAVTDLARTDLVSSMAARNDPGTGDVVRHAIALFRGRNASEHERRSAAVALAGVLEERRKILKDELLSKDEGALFEIANKFAVRHRNDSQRTDYDSAFLDWVFWWYLATIELTDRIIARDETSHPQTSWLEDRTRQSTAATT
jgi:hypothetical protein